MHTGLSEVVNADQPTRKLTLIKQSGACTCCTTEEPAEETDEVPATSPKADWQKEEPPYYHRDIF
jgi:hypothetical protein